MQELTSRQQEILEFIRETIVTRGYGPTVRETAVYFGLRSPNTAACHLRALEKKGVITRDRLVARGISLTSDASSAVLKLAGEELRAAIHAHCDAHGLDMSAFIRETLAAAIGQPLLANMPTRGRPKKESSARRIRSRKKESP